MKKRIFAMLTLSALALTACGEDAYTVQQETPAVGFAGEGAHNDIYDEGAELQNEVSIRTEQPCYLPDTETVRVTIVNNTDEEYGLGAEQFSLSRVWENGWQEEVPYKAGGDSFIELGMLVMPHDTATFYAHIAAHYDLPLAEGDYIIDINGMQTGFSVSADAPAVTPEENLISMKTEFDTYPVGTTVLAVFITNDGDEPFTCTEDMFGLEQFGDGFVSMTPFAGDTTDNIAAVSIPPHETGAYKVYVSSFGKESLPAGDYAVYLNGIEARFTVSDTADAQNQAENSALPEIAFLVKKVYGSEDFAEQAPEAAADLPEPSIVCITRDGALCFGAERPLAELIDAYNAKTLDDTYINLGQIDPTELAEQYAQLKKAAEHTEIAVAQPEYEAAVMRARYLWYGVLPNANGAPALTQIGEEYQVQYVTENETVDAVCEWIIAKTKHRLEHLELET